VRPIGWGKKIVWVKFGSLDIMLNSAPWLQMGQVLRELGYEVTLVTSYRHEPLSHSAWPQGSIVWIPEVPVKFIRWIAFVIRAWWVVAKYCVTRSPSYLILSVATFACGFPFDVLGRVGLGGPKTVLDLRTFDFGGELKSSARDRGYRVLTRVAFLYGRFAHCGVTAITPSLARAAVRMGANPRVGTWGSGWSAPPQNQGGLPENLALPISGTKSDNFILMYHGVLAANRGLLEAVQAFKGAVLRRNQMIFLLIGDGPLSGELRERIVDLGLESACAIMGRVAYEQIPGIISNANIGYAVYPDIRYWDYNQPIKVAEYLSQGVPILCSRIPMFVENYPDCGAIIYCDSFDCDSISDSLVWCCDHAAELAGLRSVAREYAERFSYHRQGERLSQFLLSLGGG
jgi:glycosyltransferase involved in cell wall biosynthesis